MLSNNVIGGVYMQLFDENPKRKCACNEAIKKGIFTKSIKVFKDFLKTCGQNKTNHNKQ